MSINSRSPKDNFNIINKCLGWGDPGSPEGDSRSLWVIGIEEATAWMDEKEVTEQVGNYECYFMPVTKMDKQKWPEEGSKVRYYTSLLASYLVQNSENADLDPESYMMGTLWEQGSRICQANLYPLGKASLATKHAISKLKDMWGLASSSEYYDKVENERFPLLQSLHGEYKPQATICFGKSIWGTCEKIFGLENSCFMGPQRDNILVFEDQRVILTGFFDNRQMSKDKIKGIAERLNTWGVKLS